jgi:hypothetical protein
VNADAIEDVGILCTSYTYNYSSRSVDEIDHVRTAVVYVYDSLRTKNE